MDIQTLLLTAIEKNASDLHLATGRVPMLRIDGDLTPLIDQQALSTQAIARAIQTITHATQRQLFDETWEADFSYHLTDNARFRVNLYRDIQGPAIACRPIPTTIPSLSTLGLPHILKTLCQKTRGIILATGPTGSGKSTTLAAMIHTINQHQKKHILTIEDPIEFYHHSKHCLINQREVGRHTKKFSTALRAALREDPDVILIGELRDLTTTRLALTAAETGHLVLATLHTQSAAKTIHRLIDLFPAHEKATVRTLFSESLQAVIGQRLLKKQQGGRIAACEVMLGTPAIAHMIRHDKIAQITSAMQTGQSLGMCTMAQAIDTLVARGMIDAPACSA